MSSASWMAVTAATVSARRSIIGSFLSCLGHDRGQVGRATNFGSKAALGESFVLSDLR